ncbi:MAG: hypothetical protein IID30_14160 [Planctomycetes bacterium]|nr:hypothetical protein [Planctomycetota bacterium]MCH7603724.1 hypothetical protein [Planctomycetota bacterium]
MSILLTLASGSLGRSLSSNGEDAMTLMEVPVFASRHLLLRGLNIKASMLSGWGLDDLDRLRDQADKVSCPCLVLIEDIPLLMAGTETEREDAAQRVKSLSIAANRLGCNAISLSFEAPDTDEAFDLVSTELKAVMPAIERLELNVLLAPHDGLTKSPDRLTDLIKCVGGFRIGSMPNFGHAAASGNAVETLRKLAPYAGAIHATITGFNRKGVHKGYDLVECVKAIRSVGFLNTLAIDFVGDGDPVKNIETARAQLQSALEED